MTDQPCSLHLEELDEESGRTRNIEIDYGQAEVRIGRDRGCDIVLESLSASRKHCLLVQKSDGWFVIDLHSTLGTFHNGTKLTPDEPHPLAHGDTLTCSTHQLRVSLVPLKDPTLRPDPHALSRLMEGLEKETHSPPRIWFFPGVPTGGPDPEGGTPSPTSFPMIEEGAVLSVGRSAECDIRLDDPFRVVSAVHARFERNWAGVFLFDASINGVYVNGRRVEGQIQIRDGDRITIASIEEESARPLFVFADAGNDVPPPAQRGSAGGAAVDGAGAVADPAGAPSAVGAPHAAGTSSSAGGAGTPSAAGAANGAGAGRPPGERADDDSGGVGGVGRAAKQGSGGQVAGGRGSSRGVGTAHSSMIPNEGTGGPGTGGVHNPGRSKPRVNWLLISVIVVSVLALATVLVWGLILLRE